MMASKLRGILGDRSEEPLGKPVHRLRPARAKTAKVVLDHLVQTCPSDLPLVDHLECALARPATGPAWLDRECSRPSCL